MKSECPCPRKESGKVKVGGKSHITVYLAEKFGRPGLSPSAPFAVSESGTQHPHSRKTELTMIREIANSHNWTQDLVRKSRERDREWNCRAGSTGKVPQTQEADAVNLKALSMALSCSEAKTYSSCSTHTQPQPPLPHPPSRQDLHWAILSFTQQPSQ